MGFLSGKRVLIVGVASKLSIASGIAAALPLIGARTLTCASHAMWPMMRKSPRSSKP